MNKKNESGFTLVEVVVSTAVGLIVLGVILSLLLTSFDMYGSYAETNSRKLATDNIMDYIHETISNTTDVRIKTISSTQTPINGAPTTKLNETANWHYLYVNEEGRLVVDGKVMFGGKQTAAYYGSKQTLFSLEYTVSQKSNSDFLTLNLIGNLSNDTDEGTNRHKGSYTKKDSILLSGLPSTYKDLSAADDDEGKLKVSSDEKDIDRTHILYFANEKELTAQEVVEPTYTIADKLNLLSSSTKNQGAFTPSKIQSYQPGQIATYNGFTYMRTADVSVDRYSRSLYVANIRKYNNYFIVGIGNNPNDPQLEIYVPSDYVKTSNRTGSGYEINFAVSDGNRYGGIAGVVVSDDSTRYLTSHPNLTASSSYFDVVYYQTSDFKRDGSQRGYYDGYLTIAPGSCILFGGVYIYSGWERLATTSVLSVPTSTPSAAEYDENSIYLPGDLFVYKDNLYEVIQMSTGATSSQGHQIFDSNGNLQSLPGENNIRYGGGGSNVTNIMARKIGNYATILENIANGSDNSTYWLPRNTSMGNKNSGTGFYGHSGETYDNSSLSYAVSLKNWAYLNSNNELEGYYSTIPQ